MLGKGLSKKISYNQDLVFCYIEKIQYFLTSLEHLISGVSILYLKGMKAETKAISENGSLQYLLWFWLYIILLWDYFRATLWTKVLPVRNIRLLQSDRLYYSPIYFQDSLDHQFATILKRIVYLCTTCDSTTEINYQKGLTNQHCPKYKWDTLVKQSM